MEKRDYTRVLATLAEEYAQRSPRSAAINQDAIRVLVDGGSHAIRLLRPFPPRVRSSHGAFVTDEDGHQILDFWQGHHANILGHNPREITEPVAAALTAGFGLQSGFTDSLQVQAAQMVCDRTGAERVRFTSSGSLATMYAIMLARAATGREKVLKIGGGWHGAQPWGLVGVDYHTEDGTSFQHAESRGLPSHVADQVLVTRFNDVDMLEKQFRRNGSRIACFIVEPFMGSSGSLPASRAFLEKARELTQRYGALLIFDEVISGFRFCAGSVSRISQVQPDLATFAKIIGGGMPVAAVGGRAEVMELAGRGGGVKFSGGTYSCHPASMLASVTMMRHLVSHEQEIYPRLALLGDEARTTVEEALRSGGLAGRCTGYGNDVLPASSMASVHFPFDEACACDSPEQTRNPDVCDIVLSDTVLQLALLLQDVFVVHGLGSVSAAHTSKDISRLGDVCRKAAKRIVSLIDA